MQKHLNIHQSPATILVHALIEVNKCKPEFLQKVTTISYTTLLKSHALGMITMPNFLFFVAFLLAFSEKLHGVMSHNLPSPDDNGKLQTYIIHVQRSHDAVFASPDELDSWYRSFLPQTITDDTEPRMVYSYTEAFSGFAARLTKEEVKEMATREGFVRAYTNKALPVLTTHTPEFLGLRLGSSGLWNASNLGRGVVIGILDTGIIPDHPSFHDQGMPPAAAKWKGKCELDAGCNNKIIAAKTFLRHYPGAKNTDEIGHGTHVASTAAGNFVKNVSAYGLGNSTAAGIAPHAHLAIYQVCSLPGCYQDDILAGIDAAVKDGIDVLSLSISGSLLPYEEDPIAIGAFAAMERGIVVVSAAGNLGPGASTLSHEAPWMLVVGASTIDRSFQSTVTLGNGKKFYGEAFPQPTNFSSEPFPLFHAGKGQKNRDAATCYNLGEKRHRGMIVVCESGNSEPVDKGYSVDSHKGVGMISIAAKEEGHSRKAYWFPLPAIQVTYADGSEIISYAASAVSPTASITFDGTVLGTSPAPTIAFLSSRGPSQHSPGILRPDITAPGVNIFGAWKRNDSSDTEAYQILSGTSMAAPHVSGIVALVKSMHPDWSPAAIKSAILTSSDATGRDGNPIKDEKYQNAGFFAMGSGHVNPTNAAEPGLVYDLNVDDYIAYLCGLGLGDSSVKAIVRQSNVSCSGSENITEAELNYPSIMVTLSAGAVAVNRTVTNVGAANAKYTVEVDVPKGVLVTVKPQILQFTEANEKKTFTVRVSSNTRLHTPAEGKLKWVSGKLVVRSPLIVNSISATTNP